MSGQIESVSAFNRGLEVQLAQLTVVHLCRNLPQHLSLIE
jgi:hypothetical protein